jgi:voltage-gated potassium channel
VTDATALGAEPVEEPRRERWERATEPWLMVASVVFLGVYAWPILDPDLDPVLARTCLLAGWVIWAVFAADYAGRLLLSRRKAAFVRSNIFALLVIALPMLRPLRLLQGLLLLTLLNRFAGKAFRGRVILYIVTSALLVMLVAALAMLQAERPSGDATIRSFGDALWWSMTTVTTVGYGDEYPTTMNGRFVATGLMIAGVALVGAVTATFASWLIERVAEAEDEADPGQAPATRDDVDRLAAEVAALRAELAERDARDGR